MNNLLTEYKICVRGIWDTTVPGITFDENGVSNYAKMFDQLCEAYPRGEKGKLYWENIVDKIKENGKICLWLYHSRKSIVHNLIDKCRKITSALPLKLTFFILVIFVFFFTLLIKFFKRNKAPNFREEIIDLLDSFTLEFMYETEQDLATIWLLRRNYKNIRITTETQFGYSIIGEKENYN